MILFHAFFKEIATSLINNIIQFLSEVADLILILKEPFKSA